MELLQNNTTIVPDVAFPTQVLFWTFIASLFGCDLIYLSIIFLSQKRLSLKIVKTWHTQVAPLRYVRRILSHDIHNFELELLLMIWKSSAGESKENLEMLPTFFDEI